ncbi:hypothetical protein [Amycolatopsis minnesotensis]|uniref:Uncharacterized protein n=1 Tax=Amycolatopsis minnesotensis TaxID=337894 RepID=A0ABN2QXY0_9PSEU
MKARLLAAAVLLVSFVVTGTPASAVDQHRGTPGYCQDGNGITVVIDFQDLGGPVVIRCAPGGQESGLTAVQNAGIEVTGVQRWGLAFLCRIEGKPGADTEACIDTPPPNAYWSYWHAPNGGSWTHSEYGLTNRKPPVGTFEGWSFSKGRAAGTTPPPRIAPLRPDQPVEAPPPDQGGAIPGREGVPQAPKGAAPGSTRAAPPSPPSPAGSPAPPPPGSTAPAPTTSTVDDPVGGVAPGGVAWTGGGELPGQADKGFPWGALIGGAGALVLGGGAGYLAWRRNRAAA